MILSPFSNRLLHNAEIIKSNIRICHSEDLSELSRFQASFNKGRVLSELTVSHFAASFLNRCRRSPCVRRPPRLELFPMPVIGVFTLGPWILQRPPRPLAGARQDPLSLLVPSLPRHHAPQRTVFLTKLNHIVVHLNQRAHDARNAVGFSLSDWSRRTAACGSSAQATKKRWPSPNRVWRTSASSSPNLKRANRGRQPKATQMRPISRRCYQRRLSPFRARRQLRVCIYGPEGSNVNSRWSFIYPTI